MCRNCLVVKSVLMFTLNVCIRVLCELIAADIRAKWSPLGLGIRGSRYKMARLLMTGEIGLCRNQSIKVKHRDIVADYESLFGIIPRKKHRNDGELHSRAAYCR